MDRLAGNPEGIRNNLPTHPGTQCGLHLAKLQGVRQNTQGRHRPQTSTRIRSIRRGYRNV